MKIAEIKSQIAELKDASRLHKRVINEIMRDAKDYEGENFSEKLKGRLDDIAMGLSSGVVGSLHTTLTPVSFSSGIRTRSANFLRRQSETRGYNPRNCLATTGTRKILCAENT